jgi:integrase
MGERTRAEVVTVAEWVALLWLPVVRTQLKASTFDSYERILDLHVLPRLGALPLTELTPRMITLMYVDLLENGRRNGRSPGLSPKTVANVHIVLHKLLADAVDDDLLVVNPADKAKRPRPGQMSGPELRFWEPAELAQFLKHVRGTRLEALWHLSALTGMRRGELLGLWWADVDFDRARLAVRRNLVSVAYKLVETTPKNHQARVVDLDAGTIEVLEGHRRRQQLERARIVRDGDRDRVFTRADGAPLHPDFVSQSFERAIRAAGMRRIRLHDLRHTHATLALRAGVPTKIVSERLGHATPEFTMRMYQHALPGMQAEAAAKIADLVAAAVQPELQTDDFGRSA